MAHQMVQEGALWPSSVIRFGPHWCNSKIIWVNIVHAVMDVGIQYTLKFKHGWSRYSGSHIAWPEPIL